MMPEAQVSAYSGGCQVVEANITSRTNFKFCEENRVSVVTLRQVMFI